MSERSCTCPPESISANCILHGDGPAEHLPASEAPKEPAMSEEQALCPHCHLPLATGEGCHMVKAGETSGEWDATAYTEEQLIWARNITYAETERHGALILADRERRAYAAGRAASGGQRAAFEKLAFALREGAKNLLANIRTLKKKEASHFRELALQRESIAADIEHLLSLAAPAAAPELSEEQVIPLLEKHELNGVICMCGWNSVEGMTPIYDQWIEHVRALLKSASTRIGE